MRNRRYFDTAEWEVLQFITRNSPVAARDVTAHFAETHGWARTTVLTVMQRLSEKGYLVRTKTDGVYLYAPDEPKGEALQGQVRDFVQKALGGSIAPFFTFLTHEAQLSDAELAQLKQIVRELDSQESDPQERDQAEGEHDDPTGT